MTVEEYMNDLRTQVKTAPLGKLVRMLAAQVASCPQHGNTSGAGFSPVHARECAAIIEAELNERVALPAKAPPCNLEIAPTGWVVVLCKRHDTAARAWRRTTKNWASDRFVFTRGLGDGLHHKLVDALMATGMSSPVPHVITTQNPIVLDQLAGCVNSPRDVKLRILRVVDGEDVVNLSDDEAKTVWSAIEAGVEQLGEILRTRGIW